MVLPGDHQLYFQISVLVLVWAANWQCKTLIQKREQDILQDAAEENELLNQLLKIARRVDLASLFSYLVLIYAFIYS